MCSSDLINFRGQFQALKAMRYSGTLSVETRYRNAREDQYNSSLESMNGLVAILKDLNTPRAHE